MIYASIDLGSDTVKIVVCEYCDNKYNVLASTNTRVVGIKKGVIKDEEMVIKSIELAVIEIEKQLGFRIDKAIISIPSYDVNIMFIMVNVKYQDLYQEVILLHVLSMQLKKT